jgi:hypothetical protein
MTTPEGASLSQGRGRRCGRAEMTVAQQARADAGSYRQQLISRPSPFQGRVSIPFEIPLSPVSDYACNQHRIEQRKQGCFMSPKVPANLPITFVKATRAESDEALLKSWLRSLGSPHTQRNFEVTAKRFLAELPEGGLRAGTMEDVRDALTSMSAGLSEASARQYVLRIKSLLGWATRPSTLARPSRCARTPTTAAPPWPSALCRRSRSAS